MTESYKIWIEQCEAARGLEGEIGTQKALEYLVGEKFLNFLEAAETDTNFRSEIPGFVAEITDIFERWQLAQYLETARETEPFDPKLFEEDFLKPMPKKSKICGRTTSGNAPVICCWWNRRGNGCWRTESRMEHR